MKIKYRLLLTYGLLVVLAFIIVGVNLITFRTMESDSNFVNYSGKLRATSYKMAQLSNVIINSKDKKASGELDKSIKLFDSLLSSLHYGNEKLGMSKLNHEATIEKMKYIKTLWITRYKLAYQSILINKDALSLKTINDEVAIYVDSINEMVTLYSENARLKVIHAKYMNLIISVVAMLAAIFSFFFMNNGIRKPITSLMKNLKELSFVEGDLVKDIELRNKDEITEMESYFNELIYDSLTKVYNRRSGLAKLSRMLKIDDRRQLTMSLCFLDINGLKQVNDVLGHVYGDELIVSAAEAIKSIVRDYDFVVRLGGDEFLIVFNGINAQTAETIWSRIVEVYDKINQEENRSYLISVSHGIVEYNNNQRSEVDNLIKAADEKMYLEKRVIKEELKLNVIKQAK